MRKNLLIFETRLAKVETKLIDQRKEIEAKLKTKATINDLYDLQDKILELERKLEANENENLQKKSDTKRMILLILGLEETKEQTTVIFGKFYKRVLQNQYPLLIIIDSIKDQYFETAKD